MKIFVDIDQTICFYEGVTQTYAKQGSIDYSTASPYKDRIEKINKLKGDIDSIKTRLNNMQKPKEPEISQPVIDFKDILKSKLSSDPNFLN